MADTIARIRLALEGQGQVARGMKEVEDGVSSLRKSMASLAGALSVGATVGKLVQVQREFDVLNSSLITMTGSSAAAQREMVWIKQFAATTPYGLNEVTGAFVKMKALGLDPSQKALSSYGNTASAMGKSLTQMIEAVADASTSEFERLRDFGIKAKQNGDQVSLTFRGVTKTIGNNSAEITAYLQRIGEVDFAGASVGRAKTLDGAISNLGDSWDELFRTVNEAGVGALMTESASAAAKALGGMSDAIRENRTEIAVLTGALAGGALLTALPTVAAGLGSVALGVRAISLALAANPLGLLVAGLGAAAGALLAYNRAQQSTLPGMRQSLMDLESANNSLLNLKGQAGMSDSERAAYNSRIAKIKELKAAITAADAPTGSVGSGDTALRRAQAAAAPAAAGGGGRAPQNSAAQRAEKEHAEWLLSMVRAEDEARQRMFSNRMDAHDKLLKAAQDAYVADLATYTDAAADAKRRLTDMQQEAEAIAYAETNQVSLAQAVEFTTIARLKEKQVAVMGNEAAVIAIQQEIDTRQQLIGAIASNDVREAGDELRKSEAAEWAKTRDQVSQSFTDALMQGGKSVAQYLKDLFRTLVLRPMLAPAGGAMSSLLGGAASAGQGGGVAGSAASSASSLLGGLGQISTLASAFGTGMAASFTSMVSAGVSGWATAAGSLIGSGSAAGIAAGLGMVAAPIAAAAVLWKPLFGRKLKDSGLEGTFGGDAGFSGQNFEFYKGGLFRSDKTKYSAMDPGLQKALAGQYQALEVQTRNMASVLGLGAEALDGFTSKIKLSFKGLNEEQIQAKLTEAFAGVADEQAKLLLGTFNTTLEIGKGFRGRLGKTVTTWVAGPFVREGESASEALRRLSSSLTAANGMLDVLGTALFSVGLKGADMASHLVDQFGGLDAMVQASAAYYQAFYSETERADTATRLLTERMSGLGVSLPGTTSEFRSLVDGLDLTTESGRKTYAELLKLSPEFVALQAELQRLAEQTAAKLIATFTARGQLVPVLDDLSGALVRVTGEAGAFAGPVSTIHRLLGDAASGTLTFGDRLTSTSSALTMSQAATAGLQTQILALRTAASGTVVDIAGLTTALGGVDTRTFVAAVVGVFELIGARIKETLSSITDERVAVREAAIGILGPRVMSAQQIERGVSSSVVGMPSNHWVIDAQNQLAWADSNLRQATANRAAAQGQVQAKQDGVQHLQWLQGPRQTLEALARKITDGVAVDATLRGGYANAGIHSSVGLQGTALTDMANRIANTNEYAIGLRHRGGWAKGWLAEYRAAMKTTASEVMGTGLDHIQRWLPVAQDELWRAQQNLNQAAGHEDWGRQHLGAMTAYATKAQLDYVAALQKYSLDASKAVTQLGRLREETVKYYESQKELFTLMTGAASSLRSTVAAFRFDQLDPMAQFNSLQERYNVAYSMAMSTTGETLAGYGDEMNSLLRPLLDKAQEAGVGGSAYSNLVNTVLARAEATATRLEANAPKDYAAESLGLLGQIDSTLAALEAGAMTADQLIVNAINAGKDTTRDGLRAVVAALTGRAVPAFAMGGMHAGGVRLVGENGPELEVTGPSRIYSAAQTRGMLGGADTGALVQEIRALRVEVGALRADNKVLQTQIMTNTGKTARQLDRWDGEGLPVRNLDGETLAVKSA